FGAFTVMAGASKDGGALEALTELSCDVKPPKSMKDCSNCKGGVTALTLRNDGAAGTVVVKDKDGRQLFNGFVAAGAQFSFVGLGDANKLGTEITISVDGGAALSIHTSCSQPIGVGSVFGAFTVMAGASKDGGALGPLAAACAPADAGGGTVTLGIAPTSGEALSSRWRVVVWRRT
ncbi:MAG TPA: hypothetical protein VJ997_06040, partial [Longimicrobiales bacterium]|nr:hypothetical protein [Longimicrobiales bacterium]